MADPPDEESDENPLVKLTSLAVLGAGLLALFLGYGWFWMVFALGFAVLVPMVKLATNEFADDAPEDAPVREPADEPASKRDALDSLRDRYARGELGDEEFERKVERLLETETLEDARDNVARRRNAPEKLERERE